jgi:hypothetical protein
MATAGTACRCDYARGGTLNLTPHICCVSHPPGRSTCRPACLHTAHQCRAWYEIKQPPTLLCTARAPGPSQAQHEAHQGLHDQHMRQAPRTSGHLLCIYAQPSASSASCGGATSTSALLQRPHMPRMQPGARSQIHGCQGRGGPGSAQRSLLAWGPASQPASLIPGSLVASLAPGSQVQAQPRAPSPAGRST